MNKEISFKKFVLFLSIFLVLLSLSLYFIFTKTKPLCNAAENPCKRAICNHCIDKNNQQVCSDCNLYNKKEEKIWTGGCVFDQ